MVEVGCGGDGGRCRRQGLFEKGGRERLVPEMETTAMVCTGQSTGVDPVLTQSPLQLCG